MANDDASSENTGPPVGSYYATLNVPRDASDEAIKRAYRHLAQSYHPDKHTDPQLQAHAVENFTRLQAAYEVCMPALKAAFDRALRFSCEALLTVSIRACKPSNSSLLCGLAAEVQPHTAHYPYEA